MVEENSLIVQTQVYFFVILFNVAIAMFNLFLATKIWQGRRVLIHTTAILTDLEKNLLFILQKAPEVISKTQDDVYNIRVQRQEIEMKLDKIRKLLSIVTVIYGFGQKRFKSSGQKKKVSNYSV